MVDNKIEVLSPAGDFETFKAAINNGADAVYLGAKSFSARKNVCKILHIRLLTVVITWWYTVHNSFTISFEMFRYPNQKRAYPFLSST